MIVSAAGVTPAPCDGAGYAGAGVPPPSSTHGYDHTLLALALLNVGYFSVFYYLVLRPLHRRIQLRRMAGWSRQPRIRS